jgi:hypothetical protein
MLVEVEEVLLVLDLEILEVMVEQVVEALVLEIVRQELPDLVEERQEIQQEQDLVPRVDLEDIAQVVVEEEELTLQEPVVMVVPES